jgi:S-adenosylmethionine:tRNA ribosyltransferase-isomerase
MSHLELKDFYYRLPPELIAQSPLAERHDSRLMLLERETGRVSHHSFRDLPGLLSPEDMLVMNHTRVFPARLLGRREGSGGRVELLLVREREPGLWEAICRPARRLKPGSRVVFGEGAGRLTAEVVERLGPGRRLCRLDHSGELGPLLEQLGKMPLPPYIRRDEEDRQAPQDRERYQTVYAEQRGSIAAPTAGLHFSAEVLDELDRRGVERLPLTLHVGPGTFIPVRVEKVSEHRMEVELYDIPRETAAAVERGKGQGRRLVAVGTTTTRALEYAWSGAEGRFSRLEGGADIFIYPGYRFGCIDALLTNFHLPESTLIMLVSALAGREAVLAAYAEAVREQYRFYSYGDCMLVL